MKIAVIDTETTGIDLEKDRIVEVAAVILEGPGPWRVMDAWDSLVNPGIPIPPEASAVHHLTDKDVANAPSLDVALAASPIGDADLRVAHNAAFDAGFLPAELDPWLCTWRSALHTWPDAPSHKNQVLRYWLDLDKGFRNPTIHNNISLAATAMGLPPHRALPDAWVTAHLLMAMLEKHGINELRETAPKPVVLRKVGFGMHFGKPWADVPADYLTWVLRQDFDIDVMHTARHWKSVHDAQRAALFG